MDNLHYMAEKKQRTINSFLGPNKKFVEYLTLRTGFSSNICNLQAHFTTCRPICQCDNLENIHKTPKNMS